MRKSLAEAAQKAGVETPKDYAVFQNRGYQGLYSGLGAKEIHERKGLKKSEKILDSDSPRYCGLLPQITISPLSPERYIKT